MSSFGLGIAAAVAAPLVMTTGFIVWDNNWTGSTFSLNLFKCNLAAIGFLVVSFATRSSSPFPSDIFTLEAVGFLMLSSTIGIIIGDFVWLEGLRLIGARRVIVVDTVKPFFAALLGWAILGEELRLAAFGGMALTVAGVLFVSLETTQQKQEHVEEQVDDNLQGTATAEGTEREPSDAVHIDTEEGCVAITEQTTTPGDTDVARSNENAAKTPTEEDVISPKPRGSLRESRTNTTASLRQGYLMAVLNVLLDTYGSVLTKQYGINMTTWEISLIRFGFAGAVMLLLSLVMSARSRLMQSRNKSTDRSQSSSDSETKEPWYSLPHYMTREAWFKIVIGVALVTFFTPALSNFALFQVALALALTLGSIGPLYALPLSWLLQNDKPTIRACAGAAMAVAGVVVLSLFGTLE